MNTRSKQTKPEPGLMTEAGNNPNAIQSVEDSDDEQKTQSTNNNQHTLGKWDAYREYEQQRLKSVKLLTIGEMTNIDQWILNLHQIYEELQYPMANRIWQTISYLQDEERDWYDKVKEEINNDWYEFCKKLKQHIHDERTDMKDIPLQKRYLTI